MQVAPAVFVGWLKPPSSFRQPLALYNLTQAIKDEHGIRYRERSTVSAQTLVSAGFLPPKPRWRYRPERAK